MTRPWGRPVRSRRPRRYSLRKLGAAVVIVLIVDVTAWLGAIALPLLDGVATFGFLVALVMFLTWFYRARVNADGHGWPQRRLPVWAIVGWFVPFVNLWFPFQMMVDIWRAGLPAESRANRATLPGIWWTCFLAFYILSSVTGGIANLDWYVRGPIYGIGTLAAIMTALLVQKVSSGPIGESVERLGTEHGPAPGSVATDIGNHGRAGDAPLRAEIEARVCFETTLDRASILGTGGFGGTRGVWMRLRGPKRLIVGTDAFLISAPQALREFVFRGYESSIAFGQAVNPDDYIKITGPAGGRQVQLAITGNDLQGIWQALAATGVTLVGGR
jgi:Domain of unknown function (DUF4328)